MINLKTIYGFQSYISSTDILLNIDMKLSEDNRKLDDESIFVAIVGEKYNPLKYLDQVIENECRFVVYEANKENDELTAPYFDKIVFIRVENIFKFIEEAGKAIANSFRTRGGRIIAIAGSNGKTTTKEMLYQILSEAMGEERVITEVGG